MIVIKSLSPDDWEKFRDIRLEALRTDPLAFGSSYEGEKNLEESVWQERIENTLFALSENTPVGMIAFSFEKKIKIKHVAYIHGVYVRPEFRGKEIGKKLIEHVLKVIRQNNAITKIRLTVTSEQVAALNLYKSYGFDIVGKLKNELCVGGKFYDGIILEKFL